jgi:phosphate transport system substrate-binding protein
MFANSRPSSRRHSFVVAFAIAFALCMTVPSLASPVTVLRVGGTGAAVGMMKALGDAFSAANPDVRLEVVPSLGSSGGIAAVRDGALDFSISSRPLKPDERAAPLHAMHFATSPFGIASSDLDPGDIKSAELARFYAGAASKWPGGAPVRVILWPRSESDTTLLGETFPGMAAAIETVRRRPEIAVAATDQENVKMGERIDGSLIAVSLTQIQVEKPWLKFASIDGIRPSIEGLADGSYPYGKEFHLVTPTRDNAALSRFVAFLQGPAGQAMLRLTGSLPASHE